jgi:hypothetical protein
MRMTVALLVLTVCAACTSGPSATTAEKFAVAGYVHAGPTCPVMKTPPDPNCADRPVPDAEMVVVGTNGTEVVRVSTDENGRFDIALPAGTYTLVPQPVIGLVGTASELSFTVPTATTLDVAYDTGIR